MSVCQQADRHEKLPGESVLLSVLPETLCSLSLGEAAIFFPKCDKFTGCSQSVLCAASQLLVNLPLLNSPLVPLGKYCLVLYLGMIDGGAN